MAIENREISGQSKPEQPPETNELISLANVIERNPTLETLDNLGQGKL